MMGSVDKQGELQFLLTCIISVFLHLVLIMGFIAPQLHDMQEYRKLKNKLLSNAGVRRDIIVNINQDDERTVVKETLLSDRDSRAKGYITKKKGDRWLNNSLDFQLLRGSTGTGKGREAASQSNRARVLTSDESEMTLTLEKNAGGTGEQGNYGMFDATRIPDRYNISRENAIYYSNDGRFSYNTVKFQNFKFLKELKDKIASNWHPPLMANAIIQGYNPLTGGYAPGYTRIMAIPSQEVALVFVLDRNGEVIHLQLLDSLGNRFLDQSCVDAVKLSKNFGKVPKELLQEGGVLVIPFIFGYFVN
jgi:TonB family protein